MSTSSGLACAVSAWSLRDSLHKRVVWICIGFSGLTFSVPAVLFLWFQWMIISQ